MFFVMKEKNKKKLMKQNMRFSAFVVFMLILFIIFWVKLFVLVLVNHLEETFI